MRLRLDQSESIAMNAVQVAIVLSLVLASGSASAEDMGAKARSAGSAAPAAGSVTGDSAAKSVAGAAKSDGDLRKGDAADVRPAYPGASIPFPYTAATEPPREPYRRPVPCSPYARGTDGSTTCIGIEDRAAPPRQAAKPAPRRATPSPPQVARREVRPAPRVAAAPRREPTDPRFDQLPPEFVRQPQGGGGFLAFLGSVFSR